MTAFQLYITKLQLQTDLVCFISPKQGECLHEVHKLLEEMEVVEMRFVYWEANQVLDRIAKEASCKMFSLVSVQSVIRNFVWDSCPLSLWLLDKMGTPKLFPVLYVSL